MILTSNELRLFGLYYSDTAGETAAVVREAMPDISEDDERAAAVGLHYKLEAMSDDVFGSLAIASGCCYA